jgi:hypothetical protein
MNEPTGPLPAGVYWRRRALAIGGTSLAVLLFIWGVAALLGGGTSDSTPGSAGLRSAAAALSSPPATVSAPPPSSPSAQPSAAPAAAPTSTTTTTPAPPPPPPACPDRAIAVSTSTNQPSYTEGDHPVLTLRITNTWPIPCTRDVSHQLRSLRVVAMSAPGTPLWRSDDCYQARTHEIRTLAANQTATFDLVWAGRTSAPGCPADRNAVPPGAYGVVGSLGSLTGPPTTFTLTP